jgi:AcrR family transcriptional regulator
LTLKYRFMANGKKMSPATKSSAAGTRQRILDAAAHCLRERGYSVRLADIAGVAGVRAGSIYYYFSSRENLVEEVLLVGIKLNIDYIRRSLDALPIDATSLDRLRAALRADAEGVMKISDYAGAFNRVFSVLPDASRERLRGPRKELGDLMLKFCSDAARDGYLKQEIDLSTVHLLVFGSIRWLTEWYRPDGERRTEVVIDQLLGMVLQGIENPK